MPAASLTLKIEIKEDLPRLFYFSKVLSVATLKTTAKIRNRSHGWLAK